MKDYFVRKFQLPQRKKPKQEQDSTISFYPLSKLQAYLSVYSLYFQQPFSKETQASHMEKHQYGFVLIFSLVISLGLISFASCIIAEVKKPKWKDIKLDGKLCYLQGSHSFGFGIAALICLFNAQIIGNLMVCVNCCSREKRSSFKAKNPTIATALLVISWFSFGVAVILLSAATSMSRRQPYGKGWLDRECYIVKDGVYIGSGVLVLVSIGCTLSSAIMTMRKSKIDQGKKIDAQVG